MPWLVSRLRSTTALYPANSPLYDAAVSQHLGRLEHRLHFVCGRHSWPSTESELIKEIFVGLIPGAQNIELGLILFVSLSLLPFSQGGQQNDRRVG